jgi:enoyl-CoA hydratase
LCDALTEQLDAARASGAALVVTGQGKMFSAGVDLVRLVEGGAAYVRAFLPAMNKTFETLFSFPRPVVAAVNGHAIAGGCILACAADHRIMTRAPGRIGIPELLVGVPFPVAPLEIVRFAVPAPHVQSLIHRGNTLPAEAAMQHGLVDVVVDSERLMDEAIGVAESLAAIPPRAFELTKQQLRAPALQRIREGAAIDAAVLEAWTAQGTLSAIREYVAKTLMR